ncbi:MAG: elongation factor P [Erysipelotrichaceae bacterium]|nr:elongation factor P [Erysipelotrichaceae bacterium]
MILVNDLKPGTSFEYEGNIYLTLSTTLNKTAMRQMVVKVHSKDLRTGTIKDVVFTGGDKVEQANVEKREMQYLYDAGEELVFMDTETYDQIEISKDRLTWEMNFLKPQENIWIQTYESEILGVILPDKVALEIVECENAVKGDTATSAQKNAVVETGWQIKVPLFIENGEIVMVSTSDGKYSGRA